LEQTPLERSACPVCNDARHGEPFVTRERIYGMPGDFPAAACGGCGSLYLLTVPPLRDYYPARYHASADDHPGVLRRWIAAARRRPQYRAWTRLMRNVQPRLARDAAIVDVGSGSGELLTSLAHHGYTDLTGLDPFIERDTSGAGVRTLRQTIERTAGAWDLIMFNHSLEHVVEPRATVAAAIARLRSPQSVLLIRPPIVNDAWRDYGIDWVQLDAPRHTFVPTETGLRRLIADAGGTLESIVYDSGPFQFWGSEWYRAGRKLDDVWRSLPLTLLREFTGELRYGHRARARNRAGTGDQAAFFVRRS
jgi:SAM-dependent methyltransferase